MRLTDNEITRLAGFMKMNEHDWIEQFTRLRHHYSGLVLKEKPKGERIFLDGNDCAFRPVKPQP